MTRAGTFGRSPRVAPSLTSEIVSIARQMQAQRDKNIMDAWKGGGTFEGQEVTDEMVLAYWQERMDGVAKDDPLWDTYQEAYYQLDYAINESKMTMRYAQGKVGNQAMANFYLNWAKKVPQNSEFYRILQRDAAQFLNAAKQQSKADAARLKEERYQREMQRLHDQYSAGAEFLTDTLRVLAQTGGARAIPGVSRSLIGNPGQGNDLTDFGGDDTGVMTRLIQTLTDDSFSVSGRVTIEDADSPSNRVVYHNPITGKAVTGADIAAELKRRDPNFSGVITPEAFIDYVDLAIEGLQKERDLAERTGHTADVNRIDKTINYTATLSRQVKAWDVMKEYNVARDQYLRIMRDPSTTPAAKARADVKYRSELQRLAEDPQIATDDYTRNALLGEANGDEGTLTLGESFSGLSNIDNAGLKQVATDNLYRDRLAFWDQEVANGNMAWAHGSYDNAGNFEPSNGGTAIGAATLGQLQALSDQPVFTMPVPQKDGSTLNMGMTWSPVDVYATDENGVAVGTESNNPAALFTQFNLGDQEIRVYQYTIPGSDKPSYSTEFPGLDGLQPRPGPNGGLVVDVSALYQGWEQQNGGLEARTVDTEREGQAFYIAGANYSTGTAGKPYLSKDVLFRTDDSRRGADGPILGRDEDSVLLAAVKNMPEKTRWLQQPEVQSFIDTEFKVAAGFTPLYDKDGRVAGWDETNADVARYQANKNLQTHETAGSQGASSLMYYQANISRRATIEDIKAREGVIQARPGFTNLRAQQPGAYASNLAADRLANTPMAQLGAGTAPGTAQRPGPRNFGSLGNGPDIRMGEPIKVPGIDASATVAPKPVAPIVTTTPAPTSLQLQQNQQQQPTPTWGGNSATQNGQYLYGAGNAL